MSQVSGIPLAFSMTRVHATPAAKPIPPPLDIAHKAKTETSANTINVIGRL